MAYTRDQAFLNAYMKKLGTKQKSAVSSSGQKMAGAASSGASAMNKSVVEADVPTFKGLTASQLSALQKAASASSRASSGLSYTRKAASTSEQQEPDTDTAASTARKGLSSPKSSTASSAQQTASQTAQTGKDEKTTQQKKPGILDVLIGDLMGTTSNKKPTQAELNYLSLTPAQRMHYKWVQEQKERREKSAQEKTPAWTAEQRAEGTSTVLAQQAQAAQAYDEAAYNAAMEEKPNFLQTASANIDNLIANAWYGGGFKDAVNVDPSVRKAAAEREKETEQQRKEDPRVQHAQQILQAQNAAREQQDAKYYAENEQKRQELEAEVLGAADFDAQNIAGRSEDYAGGSPWTSVLRPFAEAGIYDVEMPIPDGHERGFDGRVKLDDTDAEYMTKDQLAVYNYFLTSGQTDKAGEYLETLRYAIDAARTAERSDMAQANGKDNALYADAMHLAGLAGSPMALGDTAQQAILNATGNYAPMNQNSAAMAAQSVGGAAMEGLKSDMSPLGQQVLDAGVNIQDNLLNYAAFGALSPFVMAAQAGGQGAYDATQRGASAGEATALGVLNGVAEAAGETVNWKQLEALASTAPTGSVLNWLGRTAAQMGNEYTEEAATEVMNELSDYVVMGENSEAGRYAQQYRQENPGASESEVNRAVAEYLIRRTNSTGMGGAVNAAFMGMGAQALGAVRNGASTNPMEQLRNETQQTMENLEGTGSFGEESLTTPIPELLASESVQAPAKQAETLFEAYNNGTLTNRQIETLSPTGENRAAFEELLGETLPRTNSETRRMLKHQGEYALEVLDAPQNVEYSENINGGMTDGNTAEAYDGRGNQLLVDPNMQGGQEVDRVVAGGLSQPGTSSGISQGIRLIPQPARDALTSAGVPDFGIASTDHDSFSGALDAARQANKNGAAVDAKSAAELAELGCTTFMSENGGVGGAVQSDGNITGVFKNSSVESRRNAAKDIVFTAMENGGTKLDCYGMQLAKNYSACGMVPVARTSYTFGYNEAMDAQVRADMESGKISEPPDIYFMMKPAGLTAEQAALNFANGDFKSYTKAELDALPLYEYQQGEAYRDSLLEQASTNSISALLSPDNSLGAKTSDFDRSTVQNQDNANQDAIKSAASGATLETLGDLATETHNVLTHAEGETNGKNDLALDIQMAGGDVATGITSAMERLSATERWNADDVYTAKEIRSVLLDQMNNAEMGSDARAQLAVQVQEIRKMISRNASVAGQTLEANKSAPLTAENAIQKAQQYIDKQTDQWEKNNPKEAKTLKDLSDEFFGAEQDLGESAGEDFAKEYIRRLAKEQKVKLSEAQTDKLQELLKAKASSSAFYDTLLEFSGGIEQLSMEQCEAVDDLLVQAEKLPYESRARVELESQVYNVLARNMGASLGEKVRAWRYLAMLGNTRTHFRNLIGNQAMGMVTSFKDAVATGLETAIIRDGEKTKSILTGKDADLLGKAFQYADTDAYRSLSGNSKYNVQRGMEGQKRVFKNNVLETLRNSNNAALEGSDYAGWGGELDAFTGGTLGKGAEAVQRFLNLRGSKGKVGAAGLRNQFARAMAQYLKANGYDASVFDASDAKSQTVLLKAKDYAVQQAQRATFHEASGVARALNQFQESARNGHSAGMKVASAALDSLAPFKQTPANVLKQGLRYSPLGIVEGTYKAVESVRTGKYTAAQAIDAMSSGLTGTGIAALGYLLAGLGLVRGPKKDDDKEENFAKLNGEQAYALTVDGKSYTIDWAAPASLPFLMGAAVHDAMNGSMSAGDFVSAMGTIADPIMENTMLSGFNNVLESIKYGNGSAPSTLATNVGTNLTNQFVPTASGQIARAVDDTRRSTYTDATGWAGTAEKGLNKLENKIPVLSMTNEPYVDAWGRTQENTGGSFLGRLAYNALSPGYYSEENYTPVDTELERLYEATGDSSVLPGNARNNYAADGENGRYTPQEYTQFATTRGQTAYSMLEELQSTDGYDSLSDEQKASVVGDIYTLAGYVGKEDVLGTEPASSRAYDVWKEQGEQGAIEYLLAKEETVGTGSNGSATNRDYYSTVFDGEWGTENQLQTYLNLTGTEKLQTVYDDAGTDAALEYLHMVNEGDTDASGKLNKAEAVSWLNGSELSPETKAYLLRVHNKEWKSPW